MKDLRVKKISYIEASKYLDGEVCPISTSFFIITIDEEVVAFKATNRNPFVNIVKRFSTDDALKSTIEQTISNINIYGVDLFDKEVEELQKLIEETCEELSDLASSPATTSEERTDRRNDERALRAKIKWLGFLREQKMEEGIKTEEPLSYKKEKRAL